MPQARAFSVRWENLSRLRKLKAFLMDLGAVITFEPCQAFRKAHGLFNNFGTSKASNEINGFITASRLGTHSDIKP